MAKVRCEKCDRLIVKAQVLQSVEVKCECGHVQTVTSATTESILRPMVKVFMNLARTERAMIAVKHR